MCACSCCLITMSCPIRLRHHGLQPFQAPLSMGYPRQDTGVGFHFLLQGLRNLGIKPMSPALAGRFFITEPPGKPIYNWIVLLY